jgi:hypothetical protein
MQAAAGGCATGNARTTWRTKRCCSWCRMRFICNKYVFQDAPNCATAAGGGGGGDAAGPGSAPPVRTGAGGIGGGGNAGGSGVPAAGHAGTANTGGGGGCWIGWTR